MVGGHGRHEHELPSHHRAVEHEVRAQRVVHRQLTQNTHFRIFKWYKSMQMSGEAIGSKSYNWINPIVVERKNNRAMGPTYFRGSRSPALLQYFFYSTQTEPPWTNVDAPQAQQILVTTLTLIPRRWNTKFPAIKLVNTETRARFARACVMQSCGAEFFPPIPLRRSQNRVSIDEMFGWHWVLPVITQS